MSDFTGCSKMPNNIFNLSDDQIENYYFEAEKEIDKGNGIAYFMHIPRTTKEVLDNNFKNKSILDVVNRYLIKKYNITKLKK